MKTIIFLIFLLIASLSIHAQETPVIDSISIDPKTNLVSLAWHVKDTVPGMQYIIFRQIFTADPKFVKPSNNNTTVDNLGFYPIDIVRGTSLTMNYTDNVKTDYGVANPLFHPVSYYIRSTTTGQGGGIPCDPSSSMMLLPVVYDPCTNSNTLRWYSYPSWSGSISGYDVFVKLDNAVDFTYLSSVKASDTTFVDNNIWPQTTYTYFVKCKNKDGLSSSSSNFVKSSTPPDSLPKTLNLDYVSVVNNNIKLSLTFDPTKKAKGYFILRGDSLNAKYDTITSFKNSLSPLIFKDLTADPQKIHYYKVMVENSCGIPYKTTEVSTNMILYATAGVGGPNLNHLDWNPYKYWSGGVMGYKIYRTLDNGSPTLVNSVAGTVHVFDDDVSTLKQGSGAQVQKICYYIEADEGNTGATPVSANSNTVCISLDSKIEMPTAFNPSSISDINRIFKPGFDQADGYLMIIYDRWGFKIFQSSDPTIGWDGRNKDKNLVPEGVYVYYLSYMAGDNKIEQSGTVTVVATNN